MDHQVVIAGAGPVGLWLAAELRRAGVTVALVEKRTSPDRRSRALTVHPRTVETFASRGVHQPFLDEGLPLPGGHFAALDPLLDFRRLPTPFPHTLALPQVRTEELLEQQARALGAVVLRGHEVTGLAQDTDGVDVRVEGPGGEQRLRAAFVVGCDGTGSTVRAAAGIDFPGTPSGVLGRLGDVVLDDPPAAGLVRHSAAGLLMIAPMPGGLHRFVVLCPNDVTTTWPGELTLEELRAGVVATAGRDFGMRDPVWLSRFGNATRLASSYRSGRVLLAGDAAHQHFPTGGVGMNVGIQDAANLGWKLAAVLNGWASETLLDSYHTERHAVGAALVESSRAQVALMTAFSTEGLSLRALFGQLIASSPDLNDRLAMRVTALDVAYPPARPGAHPLVGTRAPDLDLGDGRGLFSRLRADSFLLLDLTGGRTGPFEDLSGPGLRRERATLRGAPAGWAAVRAALIRPDGHVAWAGAEGGGAAMAEELSAVLHGLRVPAGV